MHLFKFAYEPTDVWYEGYVRGLAGQNAIPTSIVSFDHHITRGEMAEMIYRLKAGVAEKESRTYEELAGDGTVTYADNGLYSITYPDDWEGKVQQDGSFWISIRFNGNDYVHSGYIQIKTPKVCPQVPTRTVGIVQTVTLGGYPFTAWEMIDGAAGTTYDTVTFSSQVSPSTCIVIDKSIGTLNADPLNDMGNYTFAHAAIRDAEQRAAQDVMRDAIKTIVID